MKDLLILLQTHSTPFLQRIWETAEMGFLTPSLTKLLNLNLTKLQTLNRTPESSS